MKILISHDGGMNAHFFDRSGIAKVLQYCGHKVVWWECKNKPVYDIFAEEGPFDIFYGQTYNLTKPLIKCIENAPAMRVVLRAGEWGKHTDNWTKEKKEEFPILIESKQIRELVLKLKEETNKPDFLHIHYHEDYLDMTHGHWTENGIRVVSIKNGADLWDYTNGRWREEFCSDVLYIGSNWGYKSRNLDKFILPLCNSNLSLKIKIFGQGGWSCPQFMGQASQEIVKDLMKSAAINLAISEPHSTEWGYDITEKIYKLASNKSFAISDKVEGMIKLFGDSLIYAENADDLKDKVQFYLKNPDKKMKSISGMYKKVMESETYFDRVQTIFENLNMPWEVKQVEFAKNKFIQENNL